MAPDNTAENILLYPWFPKTEPPLSGGSRSGEWQGRDQQTLGTIANSLVYEVASSRVNSLPSPWSRALQFEQAVLNPRYPTREALLNELFGCFATVGLWEMYGLKLDAERVSLSEYIDRKDEAVGPFARSLFGSKPSGENALYTLSNGANPWETLHVLRVNGVVIGFTSPTTVLCPAVHLPASIPGMKWTAEGRFCEPTSYLGAQQRQSLAAWLSHVRQGILKASDLNSQTMASQMAEVLNGFMAKLTDNKVIDPILSDNRIASLPPYPTAVALLARAAKGGISPSNAELALRDRRERPLQQSPKSDIPVILLDPEMPNRLGLPASEITLYEAATLESVGFEKDQLLRLYGSKIEIITPDDIFLPELFLLPGKSVIVNSWLSTCLEGQPLVNGNPVTPILPLQAQMRELFSSLELFKSCSMRLIQTGGGMAIEVTLMLPLKGTRDLYPISRTFPIKEQNLIDQDLPVITLWPNIPDVNWKNYYIFCEDSNTGLTVDGFGDYKLKTGREGQESVKYFTCERFPDLIKLFERGQMCGLIPVNPPSLPGNSSAAWRVGFDFGTSFTNFFINDGSGPARKSLETRVIPLTLAQKENQQNLLYKFFIPEILLPKDSNPPTSTALNTYGWQQVRGQVPELYHEARVQWPSTNALAMRGAAVHTGFKWRQPQYQKPFLKELALLISSNAAIGGAAEVNWSVSYPSAFSPNEARNYRRLWGDLCQELTNLTGLQHRLLEDGGEGGLQTEAVAFASYFGNYLARQMVHTACLDVGGGTTDMSIWQENELLHQVSIPFAGRNICTSILQSKPSFIRFLFAPGITGDIADDDAKLRQDPNFNSWLDNCLRYESDELLKDRMPIHRAEQDKQMLGFVSLMAVSFGGIYHYLGLVLKALAKEGLLHKQAPVPVYLGGNGARFINWLDECGAFSAGCDADNLMEELQRRSSGFVNCRQGTAKTTLSNAFKDETACGLISNGVNLKGNFDPRMDYVISGEELVINGKAYGALDRIALSDKTNAGDINTVLSYELGSLTELRQFVSNYDDSLHSARIDSLLPIRSLISLESLWDEVEIQVRAICLERLNQEISDLEPEPGFVIGLQALINVLTRQWAERY